MPKREITIHDGYAIVHLNTGHEAIIDIADVEKVSPWNWSFIPAPCSNGSGYANRKQLINGKKQTIYLHRFICDAPIGVEVDHIDGDRLNNRRSNLRLATRSQNVANTKISNRNTSGHKGVTWDKANSKWLAQVQYEGKRHNLGRHARLEDAAKAYIEFVSNKHGEFARFR